MTRVSAADERPFFEAVEAASKKAIYCAIATCDAKGRPRVRMVHPTWDLERRTLWFATGASSAKIKHIQAQPEVDIQYQVAPPDYVHVLVRGTAAVPDDMDERRRVWDLIDYDLSLFWPDGPTGASFAPVSVTPTRVELSRMFGSADKRIWRAG